MVVSTCEQKSKWPISSENETLPVCADQRVPAPICGALVLYIGWKSYGFSVHAVAGAGLNAICPKPLAALAVMEPDWCVVHQELI